MCRFVIAIVILLLSSCASTTSANDVEIGKQRKLDAVSQRDAAIKSLDYKVNRIAVACEKHMLKADENLDNDTAKAKFIQSGIRALFIDLLEVRADILYCDALLDTPDSTLGNKYWWRSFQRASSSYRDFAIEVYEIHGEAFVLNMIVECRSDSEMTPAKYAIEYFHRAIQLESKPNIDVSIED